MNRSLSPTGVAVATLPPSAEERAALQRFEARIREAGEPRARLENQQAVAGAAPSHASMMPAALIAVMPLAAVLGLAAAVAFGGCR